MSDIHLDERGVIVRCPNCHRLNRLPYDRLSATVRCAACKQPLSAPSEPIEMRASADFDRLIAKASVPVVVDFWAPWCGPCRMVAPELEKVARRRAGRLIVAKVNTDALEDLGQRFGIRSLPTMAVFIEGREAGRSAGAQPAEQIEAFIDQTVLTVHGHR